MRVEIVNIDTISIVNRAREDLGDIEELARSIKEKGIIQPLAVEDRGEENLFLLAGGRRLAACKLAGITQIPVRIYDEELSDLQRRSIELEENIKRKNLSWQEEINLQRDIHDLQTEIHGPKLGGDRLDITGETPAEGHSLRDTASLLGRSLGAVSTDIKLSKTREQFPGLDWDKCKNKSDAIKLMNKTEETIIRGVLAKRAADVGKKKQTKFADLYVVGDFFDMVTKIPDGLMDLVEVDPPYGIDLTNVKDNFGENVGSWYNEVSKEDYPKFLQHVIAECWRIMNNHSWLIFWFGPEPWFEVIYQTLTKQGFRGRRLTGKWVKSGIGGQTRQPDIYLGNLFEEFFYVYKGDATINVNKRGRSNSFPYAVVPSQKKIHPTERPIPLMEDILSTFAYEGARVCVPFAGSGNTLRAALNLNMSPIGYDLAKEGKDGYVVNLMRDGLI